MVSALSGVLPPGSPKTQSAGIVSAFSVKGDFEITSSFEIAALYGRRTSNKG
jgi:hypothetical protein